MIFLRAKDIIFRRVDAPDFMSSKKYRTEREEFWSEMTTKNPTLFDGPMVACGESISSELLYFFCSYADYRMLKESSEKIYFLSVSSISFLKDRVLWGQRKLESPEGRATWELVASGSVDCHETLSVKKIETVLCKELQEEAGAERRDIRSIRFLGLGLDSSQKLAEFVFETVLEDGFVPRASSEYTDFKLVELSEHESFFEQYPCLDFSKKFLGVYLKERNF